VRARRRTLSARERVLAHPGAGSPLVARRVSALFSDLFPAAPACRSRTSGKNARRVACAAALLRARHQQPLRGARAACRDWPALGGSKVKIVSAKVIVCSPGRNFVTLKLETDAGVYGLGDATLNGREKAVVAYLEEHCLPALIGRDARNIEDIWHYFYRGAYWRRGPVTMTAISAIDLALWDIKGKALNTPLYNLIGGKSRERVMVYAHATGKGLSEAVDAVGRAKDDGFVAIRVQS